MQQPKGPLMSKQQAQRMRRARPSMHIRRSWSGCWMQMWCLSPMASSVRRSVLKLHEQHPKDMSQRLTPHAEGNSAKR